MTEKDRFEKLYDEEISDLKWLNATTKGVSFDYRTKRLNEMLAIYRALKQQLKHKQTKGYITELEGYLSEHLNKALDNKITPQQWKNISSIFNEMESYYEARLENLNKIIDIRDSSIQEYHEKNMSLKLKIEKLEKENGELHIMIDFLQDENKDYKDTLKENRNLNEKLEYYINSFLDSIKEKEKLQKENEERQDTIKQLMEFQEHQKRAIENLQKENQDLLLQLNKAIETQNKQYDFIQQLQKENDALKEQLNNIIIKIPVELAKKLNLDK